MYELILDLPVDYIDYQVGDLTFALAPLCNDNSKEINYVDKLVAMKKQGRRIMMDNGAYELGKSVDIHEYIKWIVKVQPDYVVVPDVMKDGFRTCKLAKQFADAIDEQPFNKVEGIEYIVAPQGSDMQELITCWNTINEESITDAILGIPKHVGTWANRLQVAIELYNQGDYTFNNVHLLGFNSNEFGIVKDFKLHRQTFQLASIDTKWPIKNMIKQKFERPIDYYFYNKGLDVQELKYKVKGFKMALEGKVGAT